MAAKYHQKNEKLMEKCFVLQIFLFLFAIELELFFRHCNRKEISNLFVSKYVFRIFNFLEDFRRVFENWILTFSSDKLEENKIHWQFDDAIYFCDSFVANQSKQLIHTVSIKDLDKLNFVKICNGGLVIGSSQFTPLPLLHQKMTFDSKVVESDSNIIILVF